MSSKKRFYWLKLREGFMSSDTVDFLMSQTEGANYVLLYQMLCMKAINTGGRLCRQLGQIVVPFDVDKLRRDLKWFSADTIRVALELFQAVGLLIRDEEGILTIVDFDQLVGSETSDAVRKRQLKEAG